jgi:hypothetical protein
MINLGIESYLNYTITLEKILRPWHQGDETPLLHFRNKVVKCLCAVSLPLAHPAYLAWERIQK